MTPVVRYILICDDVRSDPVSPTCTHIDCLMSAIVSLEEPPYPKVLEVICVYLVLTDYQGQGAGQIRVVFADAEHERPVFGSAIHPFDFTGHSPLELLGIVFRIRDCRFPREGRYVVRFWYDDSIVEERPLEMM